MKTPPAMRIRTPTATPAELARAIQLFKWGLQEIRTLTQRFEGLDGAIRELALDGVHRDAFKHLQGDVTKLRDDLRPQKAVGE